MKKLLYKATLFIVGYFLLTGCSGVKHRLVLNLDGIKYDSLWLRVDKDAGYSRYAGVNKGDGKWIFNVPDSVMQKASYMSLDWNTDRDSLNTNIGFRLPFGDDTLKIGNIYFRNRSEMTLNFIKADTFIYERFLGPIPSINHSYEITGWDNNELFPAFRSMWENYCFFGYKTMPYEDCLEKYIHLTLEYPYSYAMISTLANAKSYFKKPEDLRRVYDSFDEEVRQSYYGRQVEHYLSVDHFENTELLRWDTGDRERVITDESIPALLIFSASWCVHCHNAIPVFKELYEKAGEKMEMVYISLDSEETVDRWPGIMSDYEIPWRSLLTVHDEWFEDKYFIYSVPKCFLVMPGGKFERIDPRNEEEREYLYKTIGINI